MHHKLRVNLNGPEHGWLTVSLQTADREYTFNAEQVPYDSVTELVRALGTIIDGLPESPVRWKDGPIEYELVLSRKDDRVILVVYCTVDSGLAGRMRENVFEFEGAVYDVVHPLWKALRDLETRQSLDEYNRAWRREFPVKEMEDLTSKVKPLKEKLARISQPS